MGNTVILVGAVALGTGFICLFCGYLWGRSNVRSQIEDALDKARISADAREFSVREELDQKMVELAELRARADELSRLRAQLAQLQSDRMGGFSSDKTNAYEPGNNTPLEQNLPQRAQEPAPVQESADKAIEKLLKSIEEKMKQAEEDSQGTPQEKTPPEPTKFAVEIPPTVTQLSGKPAPVAKPTSQPTPLSGKTAPAAKPSARPTPAVKDEWQEFAASLDALRNRQK